jgi:hypothetical protein
MRPVVVGALLALLAGASACAPAVNRGARSAANAAASPVHPVAVSDAEFGSDLYRVLLSGKPSPKRTDLLVGVVRRQFARAADRFAAGHPKAGLAALTGALYLMRAGEFRPEMLAGASAALSDGAAEVARVGNEGRSLALYDMLITLLPSGAESQGVRAHLAAIAHWEALTQSSGPMQQAGAAEREAVDRSLFDPTHRALDQARDKTLAWLKNALDYDSAELPIRTMSDRDEAIEAYRAIRAGGATLVALYLRHGDAQGALDAIDKADLTRVIPPGLRDRLERAAQDDDPNAWADLYHLFAGAEQTEQPDTGLDAGLAAAGAWGAAVGLYRSGPSSLASAMPLAVQLLRYGMAEAAPIVLSDALGSAPRPAEVSAAMTLVLRAVISENAIDQNAAAERTYRAAAPIMALAESRRLRGEVNPSPARLRYVMGALDAQAGELTGALPLLRAAVRDEPSMSALNLIAAIERQQNDDADALKSLARVSAIARAAHLPVAEADALLSAFSIHRELKQDDEARQALSKALARALEARKLARTAAEQSRAERELARVLENYGDERGARRATLRAYEAARSDRNELTATVLDAARRALTHRDLQEGRDAVQRALDANLGDEDLVYAALWLRLLERQLHVSGDGLAEQAFDSVEDASGWPAKLKSWARGKLTNQELLAAARGRSQDTEAAFYTAMSDEVSGKQQAALPKLEQVAQSPAIDLIEVSIARDLLAEHQSPALSLRLPHDVKVP